MTKFRVGDRFHSSVSGKDFSIISITHESYIGEAARIVWDGTKKHGILRISDMYDYMEEGLINIIPMIDISLDDEMFKV